ncbi:tetratricopeptide repeat domain protein [Calothrix parasitica NIES-267]|uniref:Tetratricopeptide repeat domain protein n=1 Tax=Calothrix parasitica NIES-267 TaxID=1973488 RepID=A0A1Z4LJY8_9CYAN|nr:tetratricopeptide repeat domain protein [Calothrix parasitica NIES-267]
MMKKIVRLLIVTSGTFAFLVNIIGGVSLAKETKSAEFNFNKYDFWVEKCRFLKNDKQYSEALIACEQAISLKPKKDNIQLWLARGDALLQLSQYREAVISYNWVLKQDKKNVPALVQKCSALLGLGNYEDALQSCDLALERKENKKNWENIKQVKNYWGNVPLAKVLYIKGSILRRQTEYEQATKYFDNALKQDNNFALAYAGKCGVLVDHKKYKEASQLCKAAVTKFENPQAKDELTDEQTDESVKKTINTADASDAIIWYETGRVKQKLNKQTEAFNNFNIAIQVNPRYSQALARKSEILNKRERYQEALDNCDRALKGDKKWSDTRGLAYVWYQRSAALLGLQKYEEALASSENAIAIEPTYAEAWNNKAVSLWNLGQYEAAEKAIEFVVDKESPIYIKANDSYAQAHANYGRILSSLKKDEKANEAYKGASVNTQSLHQKSLYIFWLNKAAVEMRLNKYKTALVSVNWSIMQKHSFAGFYNQAIILSKLGKYKEAIKSFDKANEFLPDNYLVLTGKAIALMNVGKLESYKNAQKTFQDALKTIDRALAINSSFQLAIENRQNLIKEMEKKVDRGVKVRNSTKN